MDQSVVNFFVSCLLNVNLTGTGTSPSAPAFGTGGTGQIFSAVATEPSGFDNTHGDFIVSVQALKNPSTADVQNLLIGVTPNGNAGVSNPYSTDSKPDSTTCGDLATLIKGWNKDDSAEQAFFSCVYLSFANRADSTLLGDDVNTANDCWY